MNIFNIIFPVFFIISIGYLIGRFKKFNIEAIVDLVLYVALPCLLFNSMLKSSVDFGDFSMMFLSAIFVSLGAFFLTFLVFKIFKINKRGVYLPLMIGNTAFIGYPISLLAFGEQGLSHTVVFDIATAVVIYSLGIYLIHHENDVLEIFRMPLIYAVVLGIFFNLMKISFPGFLSVPIEMIGKISIPAALLILGYRLTEVKFTSMKSAIVFSLVKIFGGFALGIFFCWVFKAEGIVKSTILLQSSMPSAVMTMILCHKYRKDCDLVASIVFVSTILSIFTIPLVIYLSGRI